jgi:hypothetical protein
MPGELRSARGPGRSTRWRSVVVAALILRALTGSREDETTQRTEEVLGPPFTPGRGPTTSAWREDAITRANELAGLATWIETQRDMSQPPATATLKYVREHLAAVRKTAAKEDRRVDGKPLRPWTKLLSTWGGASHERALGNLDVVEATLLRLAPPFFLRGEMPSLLAHVNRFLPKADPRRSGVERLARKAETEELDTGERGVVVAALHAANTQRRRDLLRVRSFRNVMFVAAALLLPLAVGLAIFGASRPDAIPLCFYPQELQKVVCPTEEVHLSQADIEQAAGSGTGQPSSPDIDPYIDEAAKPGDATLVEVIGLIAAIVASVVALRKIRGTSTPYSLAVALALLKIPLGALTAVLGLLLMSGGFVPGLSALDSSSQILAWALVFGFSQQLLTRLVDQRANTLLENVGGRGAAGDKASDSD